MSAKSKRPKGLATLRGVVVPVNWDKDGNVIAVAISTSSEEEYLIDDKGKREQMLDLIQREVEISGVVKEGKRGKKIIAVKSVARV